MWCEQCSLEVGTAGFAGTYSPPNAGAPGGCLPATLEVYVEWAIVSRKMPQGALHVSAWTLTIRLCLLYVKHWPPRVLLGFAGSSKRAKKKAGSGAQGLYLPFPLQFACFPLPFPLPLYLFPSF